LSKKAKKKKLAMQNVQKRIPRITPEEQLLDDMLMCDTVCGETGKFKRTKKAYIEDFVEWFVNNLPSVPYVLEQKTNLAFSNSLTTGDESEDVVLNNFLFAKNIKGETNYSVLRENYENSEVYGKDGLRWLSLEDGIINVPSKNYASLTEDDEEYYGFKDTVGYLISTDGRKMWKTDTKGLEFDRDILERQGVIIDKKKHLMIVSQDEFLNVRNDISSEDGKSPFKQEQLRVALIAAVLERLNYDIEYDGPGRLIVRVDDDYIKGKDNEISATKVLDSSVRAERGREEKVKKEVASISEQIKKSSSDNIIALSNAFGKEILHLPRVTKATDLLDWLLNEGEVVAAQILKIPATLLGIGKISGNISMEKILDKDMLTAIIPDREAYITQVSAFLAPKLGVDKICFDKYEMKQVADENDKRIKVVGMVEKLRRTGNPEDDKVADALADMLMADLKGGNGELKRLSVINRALENVKKLFTKKRREKNGN